MGCSELETTANGTALVPFLCLATETKLAANLSEPACKTKVKAVNVINNRYLIIVLFQRTVRLKLVLQFIIEEQN